MSLTDATLRAAKAREKPYRLTDGKGLYCEVSPAGNRLWRLKYRFQGREKRLSLGQWPEVGLKEARLKRDEARKVLAAGSDPGEERKQAKRAA
ncbi:MAG: Arm DNA-binding domain-containing protein, partial [Isosphaeraceae bacterium]